MGTQVQLWSVTLVAMVSITLRKDLISAWESLPPSPFLLLTVSNFNCIRSLFLMILMSSNPSLISQLLRDSIRARHLHLVGVRRHTHDSARGSRLMFNGVMREVPQPLYLCTVENLFSAPTPSESYFSGQKE